MCVVSNVAVRGILSRIVPSSERQRTLHLRKALQGLAASGHPFRVSLSATPQAGSPSAAANASRSLISETRLPILVDSPLPLDDFEELPNGLHDAVLLGLAIDLQQREVSLDLDAWVGDLHAAEEEVREKRLRCTIIVSGVALLSIEPPDERLVAAPEPGMIDVGTGKGHPDARIPPLPDGAWLCWIFVVAWNTFIHIAGLSARIEIHKSQIGSAV
jgi:hypothetical protein